MQFARCTSTFKKLQMKSTLLALAFTGLLSSASAQVGNMFPALTGETLNDEKKTIPSATKGKNTIICIAYSSDSENDLRLWLQPAYDKFIAGVELMPYDVNLYFIPMFTGVNIAGAGKAKKQLKEETDKDLQPHVLFYSGDIDNYRKELKMDKKDVPYIFVLDKDGKIIYATSGAYTDKKMEEIEDKLE